MKNFVLEKAKSVWKDPVMSKVISATLIGLALWLWRVLSSASFSKAGDLMASPVAIPVWLLLLLTAGSVVGLWCVRPRRKPKLPATPHKPLVHDITDASSLVAAWWPKPTGYFPDDVHVDYDALDGQLSLAPGVAKLAVLAVASQKCFKIKIAGNRFATFEYDHAKAYHG